MITRGGRRARFWPIARRDAGLTCEARQRDGSVHGARVERKVANVTMSEILQPGVRFGGYEIVRQVGSGAQAEVYEALDPTRARRAIKILTADAGLSSEL